MIFKSTLRSGSADISDLRHDPLVCFQHQHYFALAIIFGYVLPATIPGLLWNDWAGGLCFAAAFRLTIAHHVSTHAMYRGLSFPLPPASYSLPSPIAFFLHS
jgi:fatty-acid desaturase